MSGSTSGTSSLQYVVVLAFSKVARGDEDDEYRTKTQTYYSIAHSNQEAISEQPGLCVGGSLKEYQVLINNIIKFSVRFQRRHLIMLYVVE